MMQMTDVLLSFAGGIFSAVLLYKAVHAMKRHFVSLQQRRRHERIIYDTLSLALDQRSVCRIEMMEGAARGSAVEGVCVELAKDYISVECAPTVPIHHLRRCSCHVFVEVTTGNKKAFYHFSSLVFETDNDRGVSTLYIDMPSHLELGQKRTFLRCRPQQERIMIMGLWSLADGQELPTKREQVRTALFMHKRNESSYMGLDNMSAGGVLVTIAEKAMGENAGGIKNGTHVLLLVVLAAVEKEKKPLALWLSCRVTSLRHVEREKMWLLGMRFENWASVGAEHKEIVWFPADKEKSIPQLATWVMRTHLEQSKHLK